MKILENIWYAAAWSRDIGQGLSSRQIFGEPLVLYRKVDGEPVALLDRCPHRFAPLSMGNRVGDNIECLYHGLKFNCLGNCVENPHGDGRIPASAKVRRFQVVDRHGLIWIWAGDESRADASTIPAFDHLASPKLKTIGGEVAEAAHYELIIDNLMDLSHVNYLHTPYQKIDGFLSAKHDIVQEGVSVASRRTLQNTHAPQSFRPFLDDPDGPVDYWLDITWRAPSCCQLETGVVPVGRPREEGVVRIGTHIVTPRDDTSSTYFYASSRNYQLDNPAADEATARWQQIGFHEQDKPMVEAVQTRMNSNDLLAHKPILLTTDAAAIRVRRMLKAMIEQESAERTARTAAE